MFNFSVTQLYHSIKNILGLLSILFYTFVNINSFLEIIIKPIINLRITQKNALTVSNL